MTIEEIYYSEDISVRSFNVCNDNDLKDLNAILKHYSEHKTFDNLRKFVSTPFSVLAINWNLKMVVCF